MSHRSNICLEEPACVAAPEVPCGGVCDDDGVPCDFVVPESGCCNPCVPSASEPAMAECCGGSPASANVPRQRSQGHIQQQCYNCSCGRPDCVPMKKVVSVTHPRSQFAPNPIILITSPTMNTPPSSGTCNRPGVRPASRFRATKHRKWNFKATRSTRRPTPGMGPRTRAHCPFRRGTTCRWRRATWKRTPSPR